MADERMFSQLMTDSSRLAKTPPEPRPSKKKVLHLSVNLPEDQAELVDRYYSLLYPTDRRTTRSAIIGLAMEILDRILEGTAPETLDISLLDAYARTREDTHAGAQMRTRAQAP
jgi:hypothetical protein